MQGITWNCLFCKHQTNPELSVYCVSCGMPREFDSFQLVEQTESTDLSEQIDFDEPDSKVSISSNEAFGDTDELLELVLQSPEAAAAFEEPKDPLAGNNISGIVSDSTFGATNTFNLDNYFAFNEKSSSFATNQIPEKHTEGIPNNFNTLNSEPRLNFQSRLNPRVVHSQRKQSRYLIYIIIALIVISAVFSTMSEPQLISRIFNGFLFHYKALTSAKYPVTGHEWLRAGTIISYKSIKTEGWNLPIEAQLIGHANVLDHYQKTLDHYEIKATNVRKQVGNIKVLKGRRQIANGSYEDIYETRPAYINQTNTARVPIYKNRPVYKNKYVYIIQSMTKRPFTIGAHDKNPYWPKMNSNSKRMITKEEYYLWVKDKNGQTLKVSTRLNVWQQSNSGDSIALQKTDDGLKMVE